MMKKIISVLLVALFLVSCGSGVSEAPDVTENNSPDTNLPEPSETADTGAPELPQEPGEPSPMSGVSKVSDSVYRVNFENGTSVEFDVANAEALWNTAKEKGYTGSLIGWLGVTSFDIESKFFDSDDGANAKGRAIASMLENFDYYFEVNGVEKTRVIDVVKTEGYYVNTDGKSYPEFNDLSLAYSQLIEVEAGDVITLLSNGEPTRVYRTVAYRSGATKDAAVGKETLSYKVTGDTTHVIMSFVDEGKDYKISITNEDARVRPVLKRWVDADTAKILAYGTDEEFIPDLSEKVDTLNNGYIKLQSNHIVNNKTLVFSFEVDGLKDDALIGLGHGETSYGGSGVEITADRILTYNYAAGRRTNLVNEKHGIDISGKVTVTIKTGLRTATVTIDNGEDKYATTDFQWFGRNGEIFAKSVNVELKNARLDWRCDSYRQDVWFFGDSYFDVTTTARWPYYMVEDGITEFFLNGFPGRKTQEGLEDFKKALEFSTPKYAVWCLGMNNGDTEKGMNANYRNATEEFLAICEENGITPILSTIPNTPTAINVHKNEWVKASGYRYVDFAAGVDAVEMGSPWPAGMLSGDKVHPAPSGAEALYRQLKKDISDILVK
ncbi:MAG: SGNH/GDSL hydrolase family protein [Clostridia bacterium]|nr:SGNH/GDSL hydrolase family protein [Clostridia bacterium]